MTKKTCVGQQSKKYIYNKDKYAVIRTVWSQDVGRAQEHLTNEAVPREGAVPAACLDSKKLTMKQGEGVVRARLKEDIPVKATACVVCWGSRIYGATESKTPVPIDESRTKSPFGEYLSKGPEPGSPKGACEEIKIKIERGQQGRRPSLNNKEKTKVTKPVARNIKNRCL
ncbi:hypothetical protein NDU88_003707 [Pleurodeles waltl]|uniref:Uncharacterized protein n=1 Tax=Pleurodeles waltl TaxID=8319 RepID=A0AAV7M7S0_PLEWA|nr:hypothetical protein NDU88_003707 [Pleurodeles waltl]